MMSSDVTTCVNATLTASGITPSLATITLSPSAIETTHLGDPITLKVSVDFSKVSWIPPFFIKSGTQVSGAAIMSSERP
jgi:hypothetical protein